MQRPTQGPHRGDDTRAPWPVSIKPNPSRTVVATARFSAIVRCCWFLVCTGPQSTEPAAEHGPSLGDLDPAGMRRRSSS